MQKIAIEIVIEIGMEQTRLFLCNRIHCAENRQSPSRFFREWVERMNIYVVRALWIT